MYTVLSNNVSVIKLLTVIRSVPVYTVQMQRSACKTFYRYLYYTARRIIRPMTLPTEPQGTLQGFSHTCSLLLPDSFREVHVTVVCGALRVRRKYKFAAPPYCITSQVAMWYNKRWWSRRMLGTCLVSLELHNLCHETPCPYQSEELIY